MASKGTIASLIEFTNTSVIVGIICFQPFRYTTQFTVASLAVAIFLVLASLLASTLHFRYKGEIPEDSEDGSFLDDDADDYGSDRDDLKVPVTPDDSIAKNSGAV